MAAHQGDGGQGGERDRGDRPADRSNVNTGASRTTTTRGQGNKLLTWMNINAQSLVNKMNEFRLLVKEKNPDLISITESWGNDSITDGIFAIKGYNMYRDDKTSSTGGGALLYIKDSIEQRNCKTFNSICFESSVWCWIVGKGGKKILVGTIYRSPNSNGENDKRLAEMIKKATEIAGQNRFIILGDFNLPNIDWANDDIKPNSRAVERDLFEIFNDCFWHQHVYKPTRFRNDQASTLDLIFTNEENDVKDIEVLPGLGSSDHGIVTGKFVCTWKSRVTQKPRRLYQKGDYAKINEELNLINWAEKFENKTTNECWIIFRDILSSLVDRYIPMSQPKDHNEPWMNDRLLRKWKRKHFAWKRFTESRSYHSYQEYKKETNDLKKQARKAKRIFEKRLAKGARHNKKAFFRYVNSKLTVRPEISELQKENGDLVDKDNEICDTLGEYFSSVFSEPHIGQLPDMNELFENVIGNINITREDIQKRLEKLDANKSCGPDNIHPFVLKETATATSTPLEWIFTKSLSTGECPDDWRSANVTPIHKKGDRTLPSNYRPVSLTSQVCKILESVVREHLLEHLNSNNILSDKQHGFRQRRSCLTNLLETFDSWTRILENDNGIDVAYLDFRKAFDLVSHQHLLHKMANYGIRGQTLNWIKAFLLNRTQRVVVRGAVSKHFDVTSGVPQGSVLGPVLFLIFINDLPLEVISPLSLFADDSKIFTTIVKDDGNQNDGTIGCEALQKDLDNTKKWADRWKMEFNVDKCKIMHLGRVNPRHVYSMDGVELTVTSEEKDLGVLVDDKLDFGKHIREIVNKANRRIGLIKKGFDCLDTEMFMYLYPVLIRPLLEYCVQIWSPHKQGDIDLLERVQRRATKIVPALRNLPYAERLRRLNLTTLEERRIRGDMIETYKILTGKEDINPSKFFTMARSRGDPSLRHNMRLYKPRPEKDIRRHFMVHRVIDNWNLLDKDVVEVDKTSTFKRKYDKWVAERRGASEASPYLYYLRTFRTRN